MNEISIAKKISIMKKPIYLDNNATTPLDPRVIEEMLPVLTTHFGNPSSKTHAYGWYTEELVKIARERIANAINADPDEIIFTSCATESINLALKGTAAKVISKKTILSSPLEHSASLDTLSELEKQGFKIKLQTEVVSVSDDTFLLNFMLANNEIGSINDISKIRKLSKAMLHVDASQALSKISVDVKELGADLVSFNSHKIYGPKGVGALYVKKGTRIDAQIHGGGHENGLRSGTLNVPGIVGFGKACELAAGASDKKHLENLSKLFFDNLKKELPNISLNGPDLEKRLPGNLNIRIPGVRNTELIAKTNSKLAYSLSSACTSMSGKTSRILSAIGLSEEGQKESIRIGIGRFNTEEEIVEAVRILVEAA